MNDETSPETRDDRRDLEIAAALRLEPLDDATRRRLVRTAVAAGDDAGARTDWTDEDDGAPGGRRASRVAAALGIAAALVAGVVVGSVIVTRPDDPAPTTAARAPETVSDDGAEAAAPDPAAAGSTDAEAPASTTAVGAGPGDLGDLGSVTEAADLRPAVERRLAEPDEQALADEAPVAWPCATTDPATVGLGSVQSVGVAEVDGAPVAVLVGPDQAGQVTGVLVDPADACRPRASFLLDT